MKRLAKLAALALVSCIAACGGAKGGHLMVDHPVYQYQPPESVADDEEDSGSGSATAGSAQGSGDEDSDDGGSE